MYSDLLSWQAPHVTTDSPHIKLYRYNLFWMLPKLHTVDNYETGYFTISLVEVFGTKT